MSRPTRPTTNLPNAIELYESSDLGYTVVANRLNVPRRVLAAALESRGTLLTQGEANRRSSSRSNRTRLAKLDLPEGDICDLYLKGMSENEIARTHAMVRSTVRRILIANGVEVRNQTEANRLMMSQRSTDEHLRNTQAAHDAVRGTRLTFEERCERAQLKHGGKPSSAYELLYDAWLRLRGIETIYQHAVGPYNCDLASGTVAVEIFGGNWHGTGKHAATFVERSNYILNQGWTLVIVWVNQSRQGLSEGSADYLAAIIEQSRRDPTLRGQYRVIWSNGEEVPTSGRDLHEFATVPPRGRRVQSG